VAPVDRSNPFAHRGRTDPMVTPDPMATLASRPPAVTGLLPRATATP
jgi:hypothetical protein